MGEDDFSPFVLPTPGATNPELAQKFLDQHRGDMAARQPDIDNVLGKMQLSTDSMTKILDDTAKAIKSSRQGQTNLPLMAMAAGMLSSHGNFGNQLGAGFGAVIPTVQKDRESDDHMNEQLAQLALRKSAVEQGPLEAKLAYMKALQSGDLNATRAIEQALIRAQSSGGSNSPNNPKIISKAVQDSLTEARKQVDSNNKEMYATADEREADLNRRFVENIRAHQAAGIPIPDAVIEQIRPGASKSVGNNGPISQTRKSFFDAPTPETLAKVREEGMPGPPTGYIYQSIGPADRPKMLTEQTKNFQKETKDFDEASSNQQTQLDNIKQIEDILNRKPKLTGPVMGVFPNSWERNTTTDAKTLQSLFNSIQLHSVPKGQGAVSNLERDLFASASPNMENTAEANKKLLSIQRNIIERDKDRRNFFTQYFNTYRTSDGMVTAWDRYINSPAGSAFSREQDGSIKPNERMPWREFFKKEDAGSRAKGGYIKLGAEYD